MGGLVPFGYESVAKKLVINEVEAKTIRLIFERYQALCLVIKVKHELDQLGLKTKVRYRQKRGQLPKQIGGLPFHRGHLYQILRNPIYAGKIRHKEKVFEGEHSAIIQQDVWDAVQAKLSDNAPERVSSNNT